MQCPKCGSERYIKNGCTYYGKQRYQCKDCKRQYVEGSEYQHILPETWELVDKLLLEKIPLAGIARITNISESHLQNYVNRKLESVHREAEVVPKKQGRLAL
jgi:insertion element IS1 protein InsB